MFSELINFLKGLFMSEETTTLVPGETETLTGSGTVTTSGDIQSTVTGEPTAPVDVVVPEVPAVDQTVPPVDAVPAESAPVVDPVPAVDPAVVEAAVAAAPVKVFYNGQEVVERFGLFDGEGAQECKLADGTTTFVPKSVLGE